MVGSALQCSSSIHTATYTYADDANSSWSVAWTATVSALLNSSAGATSAMRTYTSSSGAVGCGAEWMSAKAPSPTDTWSERSHGGNVVTLTLKS